VCTCNTNPSVFTGGVGSAANAGIGFIVGYVGASHVPKGLKETHANALMAGKRADNGRGADIVVEDMSNLLALVVGAQSRHHCAAVACTICKCSCCAA
jgi:hypothetical protein